MAEQSTRDLKLVQYLNEAYGKEKELETALNAHIAMTTKAPYKKRLQQHLKETKGHARQVERRIKQLGGQADLVDAPGPIGDAASVVTAVASKAVSAAKGPLHALRGTGENEKMLKNAKTEYWNEFEEIATYRAIETLADEVGDTETAKLARGIRREEERMAKFLESQIPQLTKGVAREEIPAAERRGSATATRRTRTSRARANGGRASSSRSRASSSRSRASSSRSGGSSGSGSSPRSGGSSRSSGSSRSGGSSGAGSSPRSGGSSRPSGSSRSSGSSSRSSGSSRSGTASRSGGSSRSRASSRSRSS